MSQNLISEPIEVYLKKAKDWLTSHQLADFRRSPRLYYKKKLGLIEEEDRPGYLISRALHTLVLEGPQRFKEKYAVGRPINPKTGEVYGSNTKAFAEWSAAQGKQVLTIQQKDLVQRMADAVQSHSLAVELLNQGEPKLVVRIKYCLRPCQIRMDWFDLRRGIVDLKTCDDLDWFEADARRYGYVHEMAFYHAVLAEAISLLAPVHLIAVEKKEPYRCGVWKVHDDVLEQARRENEIAIERLRQCMATGTWPTGYEDLRIFDRI